jgi:hypothetical protein
MNDRPIKATSFALQHEVGVLSFRFDRGIADVAAIRQRKTVIRKNPVCERSGEG